MCEPMVHYTEWPKFNQLRLAPASNHLQSLSSTGTNHPSPLSNGTHPIHQSSLPPPQTTLSHFGISPWKLTMTRQPQGPSLSKVSPFHLNSSSFIKARKTSRRYIGILRSQEWYAVPLVMVSMPSRPSAFDRGTKRSACLLCMFEGDTIMICMMTIVERTSPPPPRGPADLVYMKLVQCWEKHNKLMRLMLSQ
jgi:hypothetical protein